MIAPRLSARLVLEDRSSTPDGGGGADDVWTPIATHQAALSARSATEGEVGDRRFGAVSYRATMRYLAPENPLRPHADQRFRLGTRVFNILGVAEADDRRQWLTCWLEEGVLS